MIRDIISVFGRRAPQVELNLIPTAVQGREAIAQIVRAIRLADSLGFDALILARGGGSLEDLWCFNEEAVARAVAACVTPIVSAVGHETDVSISDFVADVRAPTPSLPPSCWPLTTAPSATPGWPATAPAAAHAEPPDPRPPAPGVTHPPPASSRRAFAPAAQRLDDLDMRLRRAFMLNLNQRRERLARLDARLAAQHPGRNLKLLNQRLDSLAERLPRAMREVLKDRRQRFQAQLQTLQVVSPLATLARGYSILLDEQGQAIRSAQQTRNGQRLTARLNEGELLVRVEDNHLTPVTLSLLD